MTRVGDGSPKSPRSPDKASPRSSRSTSPKAAADAQSKPQVEASAQEDASETVRPKARSTTAASGTNVALPDPARRKSSGASSAHEPPDLPSEAKDASTAGSNVDPMEEYKTKMETGTLSRSDYLSPSRFYRTVLFNPFILPTAGPEMDDQDLALAMEQKKGGQLSSPVLPL